MRARPLRLLLWSTGSTCLLSTLAVAAAAWWWPYEQLAIPHEELRLLTTRPAPPSVLPPLAEFATVWHLDLRRPLVDPVVTVQTPVLNLKLTGTVIEPDHSYGMFLLPDGKVELKGVGEQVGGAEVLSVGQNSASLRFNGQSVTLTAEGANRS